ncbi:putative F-box/FBD/LRR-repeat protein, partial [Mucuna pruriens]
MTNERIGYAEEDRISELTDDVVCHILSFLPSEEAIATSLLSTRWRFVWHMVPALDFDCMKPTSQERVNKFLSLRTTQRITRLRLNYGKYSYPWLPDTDKWLSAVIKKGKVEHLNFSLCRADANDLPPWSMFTSTTIVTLNLKVSFALVLPSFVVHLPSVKTLHIHNHGCTSLSGFKNFFYGSPALELFSIKTAHVTELNIVRKTRHIRLFERRETRISHAMFKLVIESDRHNDFIPHYFEDHLENVVKAKVYITVAGCDFLCSRVMTRLLYDLKQLRNVEFLSFADFRLLDIYATPPLPKFQNLVQLRLYLKDSHSVFFKLSARCPKLKDFEFVIMDDRYSGFELLLPCY